MVEVAEEYKLLPETLYLGVLYVDRFLSKMAVTRSKLQLLGTTCLYLAAKYEEIYPPDITEFVYVTDDTYTRRQVCKHLTSASSPFTTVSLHVLGCGNGANHFKCF